MSLFAGTKWDIAETRDATYLDFQYTDKYPVSVNGQRKTVVLNKGVLMTAFYTKPARISLGFSEDKGETWQLREDIFNEFSIPEMQNAFNPALAVDPEGTVHMVFRAFGPDTAPYSQIWYSRSRDGTEWSKPRQFPPVTGTEFYHGYPVIGTGPKGEVYIVLDFAGDLYIMRSLDAGDSWGTPKQLTMAGGEDTRPPMTVNKDGTIYVAYSDFGYLYCLKGENQGQSWQRRFIFGSARAGGHYPSIALDKDEKPVIAYRAFSGGLGPDVYRGIHVQRQINDWSGNWTYMVIDSVYVPTVDLHTPTLAVTQEGKFQVAYSRNIEQSGVPWPKWPKDIVVSESENWVFWSAPQQVTESHNGQFSPQIWPNLYWQPGAAAERGFQLVWDGKTEKNKQPGEPWFARSFRSDEFTP